MSRQKRRFGLLIGMLAALVAAALLGGVAARAQPKNAEQIIFSTPGDFSGPLAPFGFWIWCEDAEAGNPYAGACQGSMYFYGLGMVSHVAGSVEENADGTYTMSVVSTSGTPGSNISCKLTNETANPGPTNNVFTKCTAPIDNTGNPETTPNSVVVVTGP